MLACNKWAINPKSNYYYSLKKLIIGGNSIGTADGWLNFSSIFLSDKFFELEMLDLKGFNSIPQ